MTWTFSRICSGLLVGLALGGCTGDNGGGGGAPGGSGGGGTGGNDAGCDGRGDPYVAGIKKSSADGAVAVAIKEAMPAPPAPLVDNSWLTMVTNDKGDPIPGATVVVRPYMVDHPHGSPKAVVVTEKGSGEYLLEPVFFQMAGYWEIAVTVTPPESMAEIATFGFCIGD